MDEISEQGEELERDPSWLEVGDWVISKNRPELGIAVVESVTYYRGRSRTCQVVFMGESGEKGTMSEWLEKVGPPKSGERR